MIKPLIRVIPTYSGNVKIVCTTSDYIKSTDKEYDVYDCFVRGAVLSPLSHTIYDKKIEANLLSSNYSYDLKEYYKYYNNVFFSNGMSFDETNVQNFDKLNPIYDRNIDLEMGCSRVLNAKNNHKFEFFAPIYVDDPNDLPDAFIIDMIFINKDRKLYKRMKVNIMDYPKDKRNYLFHYLDSYKSCIDSKVANISVGNKNATYNGIDLNHGSIVTAISNEIGNMLSSMSTINLFDLSLGLQFKRKNIAMKQVLPLCFSIDLDKVLDQSEKTLYKGAQVEVSGYYISNGNRISWYDWSCDYDTLNQSILRMDKNTGLMNYIPGNVPNIMDSKYPSLHEARMQKYSLSNKISKMYSRWKLQASSDENPYIINLAFAFSDNQYSNLLYREFPTPSYTISGICETVLSGKSSVAEDYSLIFPLGKDIDKYNDRYSNITTNYENIMNKYGYNWFSLCKISENDSSWIDSAHWENVMNDECYYNGILHNLAHIYKALTKDNEKIDKFGVFVNPRFSVKTSVANDVMKHANYTISTSMASQFETNCKFNTVIMPSMLYSDAIAKASCEAFTSTNPSDSEKNAVMSLNDTFIKIDPNNSYSYSKWYVNINDYGFTMDDINSWYNYDDTIRELENVLSYELSYAHFSYKHEIANTTFNDAFNLFKSENIYKLTTSDSTDDIINTYKASSYEMLPIHILKMMVDDTSSYLSYIKIGGPLSYVSYKYGIKVHNGSSPIDPYNDDFVNGKNYQSYVFTPGYNTLSYDLITDPDKKFLSYTLENYITGSTSTYSIEKENPYSYYWYQYTDFDIWQDPMVKQICISSKNDKKIRNQVGFTYYIPEENIESHRREGFSYSYILLQPSSLINTQYGFNLYREGEFFNEKWIKMLDATDTDQIAYYYLTGLKSNSKADNYDLSYFNVVGKPAYNFRMALKNIYKDTSYYLTKHLSSKSKYTFMPVVYGDNEVCTTNIFIKKDPELNFYGDTMNDEDKDKDIDVIWCDVYNFRRVLLKSGISEDKVQERLSYIKRMKAKFLNKEHLYWWYNELCKDYNYDYPVDIIENWYDYLYVKQRIMTNDSDDKIQIVDAYTKLKNIHGMEEQITISGKKVDNPYRIFNYFYDRIEYKGNGIWKFRHSDEDDFDVNSYEIVFSINVTRLDDTIYDKVMKIEKDDSSEYRDIYLYRLEKTDEWERNMLSSEYKISYDVQTKVEECDPVGHVLIPLFNDIYAQEKEDTIIYAHYLLNDLMKTKVNKKGDTWYLYRYNTNNVNWMIEINEQTVNNLKKLYGDPIIYSNYDSVNVQLDNFGYDDLGYGIENFGTIKKDGTNYGFWIINIDADNTTSTFNVIAQYNISNVPDIPVYTYDNKIKLIKYVNGVDINVRKDYIFKVFKQMLPFFKVQPSVIFDRLITISKPSNFRFIMRYKESKCTVDDPNIEVSETDVTIAKSNTYLQYNRYFGNIVPLINRVTSVSDQWLLKFKDTIENTNRIVETGKYPSIGDSVIYKTSLQLDMRNSTPIYVPSKNNIIKDYNNRKKDKNGQEIRVKLLEQKHFNDSVIVYCDDVLEWSTNKLYSYNEVVNRSTEEQAYAIFLMLNRGTLIDDMNEDQKLFLFNRYDYKVTSTPMKLNSLNSDKLYKIHYKFVLK